jgi:hypothetical protein
MSGNAVVILIICSPIIILVLAGILTGVATIFDIFKVWYGKEKEHELPNEAWCDKGQGYHRIVCLTCMADTTKLFLPTLLIGVTVGIIGMGVAWYGSSTDIGRSSEDNTESSP